MVEHYILEAFDVWSSFGSGPLGCPSDTNVYVFLK